MTRELAIRGGLLVLPDGVREGDLLVRDGRIAAVGRGAAPRGVRTLDAEGAYVMPGGVDAHVHFQTPQLHTATCDSFTSGTIAAAHGGTTTVLQFCVQRPGERLDRTIARWRAALEAAPPVVDVGFHVLVTDLAAGGEDALAALPAAGVSGFKAFLAGPPAIPAGDLVRMMQVAARTGARVMVHAEDGDAVDVLVAQALAAGRTAPAAHAATRPPALETAAAVRAIELARVTGAPLYLVHVTAAATVAAIARARAEGVDVVGETCPQYLLLDPSLLDGPPERSAPLLFTPPPRAAHERAALWRGLADGTLSTVASDHSAFLLADKLGHADFTRVPQGIAGVETRLALLWEEGVARGRIGPERFCELVSTAPARAFGLHPRKGALLPGADADVVVFDPRRPLRLDADRLATASDHGAWEGVEVSGSPRAVLVRGEPVVLDGALRAARGHGRFLPRCA